MTTRFPLRATRASLDGRRSLPSGRMRGICRSRARVASHSSRARLSRRARQRGTSLRVSFWEDGTGAARRRVDAAVQPCRRLARTAGARMQEARSGRREALRILSRPTSRARRSTAARNERESSGLSQESACGRPFSRTNGCEIEPLGIASRRGCSLRAASLARAAVSIAGRGDGSLRGRGTPPAACHRAGTRLGACASLRSTATRMRRASPRPTFRRSSTSRASHEVIEVRAASRRRRCAHGVRRSRGPRRGRRRGGARLAGHRKEDGPPPDAQARDARHARRERSPTTAVREPALACGHRRRARRRPVPGCLEAGRLGRAASSLPHRESRRARARSRRRNRGVADRRSAPRRIRRRHRAERHRDRSRRRAGCRSRSRIACVRRASASASAGSTCTRRRSRPSRCASPRRWQSSRCARLASATRSPSRS